jgi:HPt (histidine-containing phosphotransfer) domain-containing protein
MQAAASFKLAGKYREIVLAVACFLLIDLAVLGLGFVISYQIAADAQAINLAGRQRMLSQRVAKALFSLEALPAGMIDPTTLAELKSSTALFGATLEAFSQGGTVEGSDGQLVYLSPVTSVRSQVLLSRAAETWQLTSRALAPVIGGKMDAPTLRAAADAVRAANLPLLDLMNQFTGELEALARGRSDRLRAVQTAGIVLALANFGFILFKFAGKLSSSDAQAETARRETAQILGSVREGLFLIDRQRRIGTQASACLPAILGRSAVPGTPFADLLAELADAKTRAAAGDFIDLLFDGRIKPALMAELNPLTEVRIPGEGERYLNFRFNVASDSPSEVSHLLVTVADITEQKHMQRDLLSARHKARGEIEMLLGVLGSNPGALQSFATDAEAGLRRANRLLRRPGEEDAELRQTVDAVFRLMHAIKGDAAAMGLALFETAAHEFEETLARLRAQPQLSPEDLLALPLGIEDLYEKLALVRAFAGQIARAAARVVDMEDTANESGDTTVSMQMRDQLDISLNQLAQRIAQDQHKTVHIETHLADMADLAPATAKHVKDIALQLARNAVAHGIENPEERARAAKPPAGKLEVRLARLDEDEYELVLRDDGRGLNPLAIREALTASGRYSAAQLAELDDRQVMMKIFEPGFSTAKAPDHENSRDASYSPARDASRDAGRGVGLDLVQDKIGRLGGRLRLASQPGRYTEFAVRFAA